MSRLKRLIAAGVMEGRGGTESIDLLNGLVAWWEMSEASDGSAQVVRSDSSEGGHDANDPTTCESEEGIVFTGAKIAAANSEYLTVPDHADLRGGDRNFMWAGWVKWNSNPQPSKAVISKYALITGKREYRIGYAFTGRPYICMQASQTGSPPITSVEDIEIGIPKIGTWYFIVFWHDSDNDAIGIQINDGTLYTTSFVGGVAANDAPVGFGADISPTPGEFADVTVSSVGRWNRLLNSSEKTALYNEGFGIAYPFNVTGTTVSASVIQATLADNAMFACRVPHQRNCFYASGRYWIFYAKYVHKTDPLNIYYNSSSDGRTWFGEAFLTTAGIADAQWCIYFDGTKVHYLGCIVSGWGMKYRRGTPNGSGSIVWDTNDFVVAIPQTEHAGDPSIEVADDGHVWIAYCSDSGGVAPYGNAMACRNDATDGTWTTSQGFPVIAVQNAVNDTFGVLSPLTGGSMYVLGYEWDSDVKSRGAVVTNDGTVSSEGEITGVEVETKSGTTAQVARIEISGLTTDGIVHLVYQSTANKILYRRRSALGAWGAEVELADSTYVQDVVSSPRLAFDGDGKIYVSWQCNDIVYLCIYDGTSWGTPTMIVYEPLEQSYEHTMPAKMLAGTKFQFTNLTRTFRVKHRLVVV